jgi:large repetitive protein
VGRRDAGLRGAGRRPSRPVARRAGVVVAGLLVVAGTTTAFDASSLVLGSAPPAEALHCSDNWIGTGPSGDWDWAANWSAGVPDGPGVDACISGNASVTLSDASVSVGELTVSADSSLTIGSAVTANIGAVTTTGATTAGATNTPDGAGASAPSLVISSGLQNDGAMTVAGAGTTTGASGHPGLTLDGPITNAGTLTVDGTVAVGGATTTAVRNDGTIGVAPSGLIDLDATSTLSNEPEGILAFGIDGPAGTAGASGQITNGTLALGGTVDPVFEDGFTPPGGAEYVVDTGSSTGTFATVLHGATADYSRIGEVGLVGGAPAATTETSVTSSTPAGLLTGRSVELTALVTPASGTSPTGSIAFSAAGKLLGNAVLTTTAAGVTGATLDVASLPVGVESITAAYSGDVLFGASTSPVLTQVVEQDPTTLTITPSVASPEAGQPVTDTATVVSSSPGPATPTGAVSFTDDGSPVVGCQSLPLPDVAPFQTACTETFGSGATHVIAATYSGDADDAGSTASLQQTLGQIPTQTVITSWTPRTVYGQTAAVVATVTPAGSTGVSPGGTVTFSDGSVPLGTVDVSTEDGVTTAGLSTSALLEGPHFLTATYSGDPTFATSTSAAPVIADVDEAATTVTVTTVSPQSVVGQSVVYTASITSSVPGETGTVQFDDNGSLIGTGAVSGGLATFETSALTLGTHPITAIYEGDDNFVGGSSTNTVLQTVGPAATSTQLTSTHDPGLVGETIAYTATVAASSPGSGAPTGTVSFSNAGNPIPTCQGLLLPAAAPPAVTCSQAYDIAFPQGITASYSGDASFTASAGTMAEQVSPVTTTTTLDTSPSASTSGQSVTLTATVAPASGEADPDGSVSFSLGGTVLGDSVLSTENGVSSASMLLTTLPIGSDPVTASFDGSTSFLPSASTGAAVVTVTMAQTTLGLLGPADPPAPGQPTTLTATVFPATGSGETGTVTFFDNGTRIGTSPVSNGQATLTLPTPPGAAGALTADYSGDPDFTGSATPTPLVLSQ